MLPAPLSEYAPVCDHIYSTYGHIESVTGKLPFGIPWLNNC